MAPLTKLSGSAHVFHTSALLAGILLLVHLTFSDARNVEYNDVFFLLICDVNVF